MAIGFERIDGIPSINRWYTMIKHKKKDTSHAGDVLCILCVCSIIIPILRHLVRNGCQQEYLHQLSRQDLFVMKDELRRFRQRKF